MHKHWQCILTILRRENREMSGNEIIKLDEEKILGRGSLYNHLFTMEDVGLVESRLESVEEVLKNGSAVRRYFYRISHGGRKELLEAESEQSRPDQSGLRPA